MCPAKSTSKTDDEAIKPPLQVSPAEAAKRQPRVAGFMDRLVDAPPQVLLFEGGTYHERIAMAHRWAMLLNCEGAGGLLGDAAKGCGTCTACKQIIEGQHRDFFFHDGTRGFIKVQTVRGLRALTGEPPRGDGARVMVLAEAQVLQAEQGNTLLKCMEEPRPGNLFVLTAPQRERLLPTLVSRSFVLTLGWPQTVGVEEPPVVLDDGTSVEPQGYADALLGFMATGTGFLELTATKKAITPLLAGRILVCLSRALAESHRNGNGNDGGDSKSRGAPLHLSPRALRRLQVAVDEARTALEYAVNPALTLEWLAMVGCNIRKAG